MTKAFEKISAGLADAVAYAQGDTSKGRPAASMNATETVAHSPARLPSSKNKTK